MKTLMLIFTAFALCGGVSVKPERVFLCQIINKIRTVFVEIFAKQVKKAEKTFKKANDIWVLGKNNLDRRRELGGCFRYRQVPVY